MRYSDEQRNKKIYEKKRGRRFLIVILRIVIILLVILTIYRGYMLLVTTGEYMITSDNYFDYQKHYECSGYASAYALRSLGVEADGVELYKGFTNKNPDGTLAPGYLWENLRHMGYKASLRVGSITDLKYTVRKGTPVVVLIRVNMTQPYLHYVPVVGYDKDYIYVADSLSYLVNAEEAHYNRKIAIEDFKDLWKNETFGVNNIYLTIGIKDS